MTIRFLDIFCRVYEKRSFSRAAEVLLLTQPTVSCHIKSIEDDLGVRLFDRLGREVSPTQAGDLLYGYARKIERLNREALEAIAQFTGRLKGRLDVGGSTIPGEYLLPDLIGRFGRTYPEIRAVLHIADTKEITEMVLDGRIDVGMIGAKPEDRRIEATEFALDELILVAPPDYPKDSLDAAGFGKAPFISREFGSGSRQSVETALRGTPFSPEEMNIVAEMGSTEAVKTAVRSGLGLAFISTLAVRRDLDAGALKQVRLPGLPIARRLYVITHAAKEKSPICRAFLDFILKEQA